MSLILSQRTQPELHLLYLAAGGALFEDAAAEVPWAVREGAAECFAFTGQLGEVLHRDIDIADLIPGAAAHHAVGGEVELPLELFDRLGHLAAEDAVHRQQAEEGIVFGDAVELPLQGEHRRSGAALPQRASGVALGDGLDVVGADDLDVAAVVVFEDAQCIAALIGQRDRPPLLEAGAGDGFSVAVLGVVGVHGAGLADIGVEDVVRQPHHDIEHRPAMDVVLVVAGGVGDVETVALAGVPLGVDAVESQRDLAVDVGPQGLLGPRGAK